MRTLLTVMAVVTATFVGLSTLATQASAGGSIGSAERFDYAKPKPKVYAGPYIGLVGTYAFSEWDEETPFSDRFKSLTDEGFLGGVTIGTNIQRGNWVLGVVGDLSWGDLGAGQSVETRRADVQTETDIEYLWTARVKAGYVSGRWLTYLTGGLAGAEFNNSTEIQTFRGDAEQSQSETLIGWTVGGGLEYKLNSKWSLSTEYLYVDLGDVNKAYAAFAGPSLEAEVDNVELHLIRAGVNYKF